MEEKKVIHNDGKNSNFSCLKNGNFSGLKWVKAPEWQN